MHLVKKEMYHNNHVIQTRHRQISNGTKYFTQDGSQNVCETKYTNKYKTQSYMMQF